MNNIIKKKLKYLQENPDKIKDYAGYIKNNTFRKCRKCRGKGVIEHISNNGTIIGIFCKCVRDNIKKEITEVEKADIIVELENGTNDQK